MTNLPPFPGGDAPGLECSRWMGVGHCGKPATYHVIWTDDGENGLCCAEHMVEASVKWTYYAAHPYNPVCSIAGAVFIHDENRCTVLSDGLLTADLQSEVCPAPTSSASRSCATSPVRSPAPSSPGCC